MSFIAAAIIGGGALIGGVVSADAAKSAASQQAGAAFNAQNISQNEFSTITGQEAPYMQSGYDAQGQLNYLLGQGTPGSAPVGGAPTAASSTAGGYGSLLKPFDASTFQQMSPAYNFQLQQGQQGVLNADSAGQGALSGSAYKDLMSFNQNLANTSFNNAFNQYQTQQGNIYSRLAGVAQLGQNAAANTGQQGTALAGQAAQSATNVGSALGAGTIGAGNAISGAISSATPWLAYGGGGGGSNVSWDSSLANNAIGSQIGYPSAAQP